MRKLLCTPPAGGKNQFIGNSSPANSASVSRFSFSMTCSDSSRKAVSSGIHQKIHDLIDGVLLIRAEPEQEFYLQRLIKIILKLLQNCAFGSTRIAVRAILYLCFAPVRINATSQLVPFRLGASQGFSFLPL